MRFFDLIQDMCHVRLRLLLVLGFLLTFSACSAMAETISATSNETVISTTQKSHNYLNANISGCQSGQSGFIYSTAVSACNALNTVLKACNVSAWAQGTVLVNATDTNCQFDRGAPNYTANLGKNYQNACPVGSSWNGTACVTVSYSCPSGYTLSTDGLSCSRPDCPAGSEYNSGGDCVTPCAPAGDTGLFNKIAVYSSSSAAPTGLCINGCSYNRGTDTDCVGGYCGVRVTTSVGESCGATNTIPLQLLDEPLSAEEPPQVTPVDADAPGSAGTPTAAPSTPEEECAASGQGYITMSGVTVCVPPGTGEEQVINRDENIKTETNPDGTGKKTETKVYCELYVCTNTETVTDLDAQGNPVGPSSTTVTQTGKDDFCKDNPTLPVCKTSSSSGGENCDVPPVCAGDAIACATLKQQWQARCETKRLNDFEATAGTPGQFASQSAELTAKKQEFADLVATIKVEAAALFTFSDSGVGTLGCDEGITVLGRQFRLCFADYNEELSMLGAALVFGSLLIALLLMFS